MSSLDLPWPIRASLGICVGWAVQYAWARSGDALGGHEEKKQRQVQFSVADLCGCGCAFIWRHSCSKVNSAFTLAEADFNYQLGFLMPVFVLILLFGSFARF